MLTVQEAIDKVENSLTVVYVGGCKLIPVDFVISLLKEMTTYTPTHRKSYLKHKAKRNKATAKYYKDVYYPAHKRAILAYQRVYLRGKRAGKKISQTP